MAGKPFRLYGCATDDHLILRTYIVKSVVIACFYLYKSAKFKMMCLNNDITVFFRLHQFNYLRHIPSHFGCVAFQ